MLGIRYLKAPPTKHVLLYRKGQVVKEGRGLSFLYYAPSATIVQVPLESVDVPFAFEEVTSDYQDATIQGQITYRVVDPQKLASLLDFSLDSRGRYATDDPALLSDRLITSAQVLARSFTQQRPLGEVLSASEELMQHVSAGLKSSEAIATLGVEVLSVAILSIKSTPEMAKALQANARERLLREADEAVFERRNVAVELERKIKENELDTEVAVEEKRRQVRETKLRADIAVEQERAELVDRQVENQKKQSAARAESLRSVLEPVKDIDWRTLLAAQQGGIDASQMIAMAFRDMADNAQQIGSLNVSSELLQTLLSTPTQRRSKSKNTHEAE